MRQILLTFDSVLKGVKRGPGHPIARDVVIEVQIARNGNGLCDHSHDIFRPTVERNIELSSPFHRPLHELAGRHFVLAAAVAKVKSAEIRSLGE